MWKLMILSLLALGIGAIPLDDFFQKLHDKTGSDSDEVDSGDSATTASIEEMMNGIMNKSLGNNTENKKPPPNLQKIKDFLLNIGANLQHSEELGADTTGTPIEQQTTAQPIVKKEVETVAIIDEADVQEFLNGLKELRAKAREAAGYTDEDFDDDDSIATPLKPQSKLYKDIQFLEEQILQRNTLLQELKAELALAIETEDEEEIERVVTEINKLFKELDALEYFHNELKEFSLSIGKDLVEISNKWKNKTGILAEFNSSREIQDFMEDSSEASQEVSQEETALQRQLRSQLLYLEDAMKDFKRIECSYVPNTNSFVSQVSTLKSSAASDGACTARVKTTAKNVKTKISQFHSATSITKRVRDGLNGLYTTLFAMSNLPYVGPVAKGFKTVVGRAKSTVSTAYTRMKRVDDKLYPTWKDRFAKVETAADNATKALKRVEKGATSVHTVSSEARDCICSMPSSSLRTSTVSTSENTCSSSLPIPETMNQAIGRIGSACSAYDNLLGQLDNLLPSGVISSIYNLLNSFINSLGPLFDIFGEIDLALNRRLCIPNPIELASEAAERTWEFTQETAREVGERTNEAGKAVVSFFSGWRKRRSTDIFLKKEKAFNFLDSRLYRVRRASSICFSVQDIINGISSAFSALLGWAEDILNEIISRIPGLNSFPGLPNFNIDFDLLDGLSLPSFDFIDLQFQWDLDRYLDFLNLDLSLFTFNLPLPSLGVSLPSFPDFSLPSFDAFSWSVPSFSIPDNMCAALSRKRRDLNGFTPIEN